jgi:hypothetical protein
VGGGNEKNTEEFVAANIPLRWMVREIFRCKIGVLWDIAQLKNIANLDVEMLYPEVVVPLPAPDTDKTLMKMSKGNGHIIMPDDDEPRNQHGRHHAHGHWLRHKYAQYSAFSTGTIFEGLDEDDETSSAGPSIDHSVDPNDAHISGRERVHGMRVYDDNDPELHDAYSKLYDQLKISPIWWILEFCPVKGRKHIQADLWKEHYLYVCFFHPYSFV